jgi:hypothetical protein
MKKQTLRLLILLYILMPFSCKQKTGTPQNDTRQANKIPFPVKIDLELAVREADNEKIPLSLVADSIEYVFLETNPECLINNIRDILVTDNHIFITASDKIFEFTRKGQFIRRIASVGKGPGEYIALRNITYDEKNDLLYIFTNYTRQILKYSSDNKFIGEAFCFKSELASTVYFMDENNFAGIGVFATPHYIHKDMFVVAIIDSSGQITRKVNFPLVQFNDYTQRNDIFYPGSFLPTYYQNKALCVGYGCDTVYAISPGKIRPRYILNRGKYNAPANVKYAFSRDGDERLKMFERRSNYIIMQETPIETDHYLFLNFTLKDHQYLEAYNKLNGHTKTYKKQGELKWGTVRTENFGFINDLGDNAVFYPSWFSQYGKTWIMSCDAIDFLDKMANDSQNGKSGSGYFSKDNTLQAQINNLNENDNPILTLVSIK